MKYTLMHKNIPIIDIDIDEATNSIAKVYNPRDTEHLPVGIHLVNGLPDRKALNDWWMGRAIPAGRSGLREALMAMNVSSPAFLLTKCYGLSLSDQYWIRQIDKQLEWKDINFFENGFSEDVGNALFGKTPDGELNLMSPDNTSDGWLKKKWIIADGKRMLIKGGSAPFFQEPLNEALASAVARRLHIPHASYAVIWDNDQPLSICEDFITTETDLVTGWHILQTEKRINHLSAYQQFLLCCDHLEIPNMVQSMNQMLTMDFLIANNDRHYNNFGAIRNADTLKWPGAAPLFDCGASMWHDHFTQMIQPGMDISCKPFKSKHSEQIKLVTDFGWIDFSALRGIDEEYAEILKPSLYIDDKRRDALCRAIQTRVTMLVEYAKITPVK